MRIVAPDELRNILEAHRRFLADECGGICADLRGADLREADLRGVDLRGVDLFGADLRGANLREANLREADLRGANLRGVDLFAANLREADLSGADLSRANLRGANLRGADLRGVDLFAANLREADLSFSSGIPFWCGGVGFIGDDRLAAQMIYHLTRGDWSKCSGGVRESIEHIRSMAITNLFCEYRDDLKAGSL